jgi:hypothetical protein
MCLENRKLKDMTKRNVSPSPRSNELLRRLQGVTQFSTLGLAQGYYQMGISALKKQVMGCMNSTTLQWILRMHLQFYKL